MYMCIFLGNNMISVCGCPNSEVNFAVYLLAVCAANYKIVGVHVYMYLLN